MLRHPIVQESHYKKKSFFATVLDLSIGYLLNEWREEMGWYGDGSRWISLTLLQIRNLSHEEIKNAWLQNWMIII